MRFRNQQPNLFQNPVTTNSAYNATLRQRPTDRADPVDIRLGHGLGPSPFQSTVGPTGDWSFVEELDANGISILTLKYKGLTVHTFAAQK
jgi:hypothetical protein